MQGCLGGLGREALRNQFSHVPFPDLAPNVPLTPLLATGAPTTPATVTINGGASSLTGASTWPDNVDPSYDTLAYRLVNVNENGNDASLVLGANAWKVLAASDITESSGTFSFNIPDTISVGGGSPVTVASPGRYRLDMHVATNNGAAAAGEMLGLVSNGPGSLLVVLLG